MNKQTVVRVLRSRPFQLAWSGVFTGWGVFTGLTSPSVVAQALGWALVGFMCNNGIMVLLREQHHRAIRAEHERARAMLQQSFEHLKADMQQWAGERGMDLEIDMEHYRRPGGLH